MNLTKKFRGALLVAVFLYLCMIVGGIAARKIVMLVNDGRAITPLQRALYYRHGLLDTLIPNAVAQGVTLTFANGIVNQTSVNCQPQNTNCSSALTPLQFITLPPGALNGVNRSITVNGDGIYTTTAGQTPTLKWTLVLTATVPTATSCSGTTLSTIGAIGATTASQTNIPWHYTATVTTAAAGASGTLWPQMQLSTYLGSVTIASSTANTYISQNTAVSATTNLTGQLYLCTTGQISTSNASNALTQYFMEVFPKNFSF